MNENIKSIFDRHGAHLKFDAKLLKEIHQWRVGFANRNQDHAAFFGGNLFGVHPIRFRTSDRLAFTDEILGLDEYAVRKDIIALDTVDESWIRGTDVMNLACCWLTHRFYNSTLSDKLRHEAMVDCQLVFQYKLLTSLMAHFFTYPTDESTALAVYAALSKKYALKQYGTWQAMLEARAEDIIGPNSIHHPTITTFDNDGGVQYMITDIQGRLRAMMKNMYDVFLEVKNQDKRILARGGTIELEGKTVVKDLSRDAYVYQRYISEVMMDRSRFIKEELVELIGSAMHTMNEKQLLQTLNFIVDSQGKGIWTKIEELAKETLIHAFEFIRSDQMMFERSNDIQYLIIRLRALYMSSRSKDPAVEKMRELGELIVSKAIHTRNPAPISAVRTGLLLYIVTRTLSRRHYG